MVSAVIDRRYRRIAGEMVGAGLAFAATASLTLASMARHILCIIAGS